MTGFGQATAEGPELRVSVTARSVNHRYLDLALRLRDERPETESKVRELVAERVHRGRVDLAVDVESSGAGSTTARIDDSLLVSVQKLVNDLAGRGLVSREVVLGDLLRIPDLVRFERGAKWSDDDQALLLGAVADAMDSLVSTRAEEGTKLHSMLVQRIDGLESLLSTMREQAKELPARNAEALRQRLDQLTAGIDGDPVDEQRLAQEVAILADRSDIAEELDRLGAHLEQFRAVCDENGTVGKRLDFLAQEIFRELNTIGSKCRDSDVKRCVVDGKVLCEQLREQVQNVE